MTRPRLLILVATASLAACSAKSSAGGTAPATGPQAADAAAESGSNPAPATGTEAGDERTEDEEPTTGGVPKPPIEPAPGTAPTPGPTTPSPAPAPTPLPGPATEPGPTPPPANPKLSDPHCIDPALDQLTRGVQLTLCDGTTGVGTLVPPTPAAPRKTCRNLADLTRYDAVTPPARPGADPYDTMDDFNAGAAYPGDSPWSASSTCGVADWRLVCDGVSDRCHLVDTISELAWVGLPATQPLLWQDAAAQCAALVFAGADHWRLPTQKELMSAYVHGMRSADSPLLAIDLHRWYWSATAKSANKYVAWRVQPDTGAVGLKGKKKAEAFALCVRG